MRVLLVINAIRDRDRERASHAGHSPRKDYLELQRRLGADVLDLEALDRRLWTRIVRRIGGAAAAQALVAWARAGRYDVVFADRESAGFIIAALYRVRRRHARLVVIGHLLSARKKQLFAQLLRLPRRIDRLIVHSSVQQQIAQEAFKVGAERIAQIPYHADDRFWAPRDASCTPTICSVGLEFRDYDTLLRAIEGLDVDVVLAAASHWSKHRALRGDRPLPPNVRIDSFNYADLRQLYSGSLFVVVPLHDVENQAGITTILEAMAMGKAVIVSHTRGQVDIVRDRRARSRWEPHRATQPEWARQLGATEETAHGQTGIYVRPHDPVELRRAILYLLQHPEQARRMGANGRRLIEETMTLDLFTERVAAVLQDACSGWASGSDRGVAASPR